MLDIPRKGETITLFWHSITESVTIVHYADAAHRAFACCDFPTAA